MTTHSDVCAGGTLPGALAISIEAEALQCDSHLPGNDAVILHSQPGLRAGKPGTVAQAPLQFQLEVCLSHVPVVALICKMFALSFYRGPVMHRQKLYMLLLQVSMGAGGLMTGFDLQGCWVNLLLSKIPVLVVAADDALLACADRVLQHLKKPGISVFPHLV